MKIRIFLLCIFTISTLVKGQENSALLLLDVPQRSFINTAYQPYTDWYLALPLIGNYSLELHNSGFSWNQFIENNLSSSLTSKNTAVLENRWQFFGAGYKFHDMYFTFDISQKRKANFIYPESFMGFTKGNWDYNNNSPINYSTGEAEGYGIDYTELSLGFSKPVTDIFTFGIRIKYLIGAASIKIDKLDVNVNTQRNGEIVVNSETSLLFTDMEDVSFISRGPFNSIMYNKKKLHLNGNYGFGLDAGFCASLTFYNKPLIVGLAFNDLGFIKWDNNSIRHEISSTYTIEGVDITNEILGNPSSSFIDYWDAVGDSLDVNMTPRKTSENYSTNIQGNINLTATYLFNDVLTFGSYFKNYYVNNTFIPKVGISAGLSYKNFSTTIGYFAAKNSYTNLGLGLSTKINVVQIYAGSDNLSSLFIPHKTKSVSFKLGVNIISNLSSGQGRLGLSPGNNIKTQENKNVSHHRKTSSDDPYSNIKKRKRGRHLALQKIKRKKHKAPSGKVIKKNK